jgi:hypothetical protein
MMGLPVSFDLWPFTASMQAGIKIVVEISPVCPPPSPEEFTIKKKIRMNQNPLNL